MARVAALDDRPEPEGRRDRRCVGVDVRAHDDDVARLQRRVVLEQPGEDVAEYLDLSRDPVGGVDLDRGVGGCQVAGSPGVAVRHGVGPDVVLEPAEKSVRARCWA